MQVLVQIDVWDPVSAQSVPLRMCSHDDPRVCHASGVSWAPMLSTLPTLRYDLFDGAFGQEITSPASSLTAYTEIFPNFARFLFPDARFQLWTGDVDDPANVWTQRFDGRVTAQPEIEDGVATIQFAVDDRWLDGALLSTYAGTTGAEGPAAMKGQAKPWALGAPRYVPGKLIDSVNGVFQVSAYGNIQEFEAALERLVRFGAPIADYASYAALVAAAIPAGAWATARAVGMARFGAPTEGQVSFLIKGDNSGSDGWARKPGQLIRQIAKRSGGTGKIDDASLNALDVARPYNCSIYIDDQSTARELIQRIAASVNAVAGVSWLGKLFVVPVEFGTASVTLAADGSALPPVASVKQIDIAAPFKKVAIGAETAWQVHELSDIAFTAELLPLGLYSATTIYREGNLVDLDDGSQWLYIATTPAAGNAPPTTGASNAWWFRRTPPTKARASDGTPLEGYARDSSLYDPFDYATVAELQQAWGVDGVGNVTIVTTSDTGGRSIQGGDASGNDAFNLSGLRRIPYSPEDLYELAFDIEGLDAGNMYLGIIPFNASGNVIAPSDAGSYCYAAAVGHGQAGRKTWKGYVRGTAAVGTGANVGGYAPDPANPAPLPVGTVEIAAIGLFNYPNTANRVRVHEMTLRKVVDNTVVATGAWAVGRTYFRNEGVTYLGRSFGSKLDNNTGHQPPASATSDSWWYLIADKGADGAAGLSAYSAILSNENHTLPADAAGNVLNYAGASATFKVFYGATDVTSSFNFSSNSNPQSLIISGSWPTFTVTGGFDAGEDVATFSSTILGSGAHAGVSLTKVFTLGKSKTGTAGGDGADAKLLTIEASGDSFKFTKDGVAVAQTITFTVRKQNISGAPTWTIYDRNGTSLNSGSSAAMAATGYFSNVGPDVISMSHTQFEALAANPARDTFFLAASLAGVSDRVTVNKLQDGATGPGVMTLVNKNGMAVAGAKITKVSPGTGWDGSAHSLEGHAGPVQAAAQIVDANTNIMIGLNSDPNADASYTSIDAAAYCSTGSFNVYLQGVHYMAAGSVASGQFIFARRTKDGFEFGVLGEPPRVTLTLAAFNTFTGLALTAATKLFFDSSIYQNGAVADACSLLPIGANGEDGTRPDFKFRRSVSQPTTPTGDEPAGWSDDIPSGTDAIWMTVATKTLAGALLSPWSTPQSLSASTPRGEYAPGTTYYLYNTVTYGGGTYIAAQNGFSGQAPSGTAQANAYWDVVAAPGAPGAPATPPSGFSATINVPSGAAVNLRSLADANGYTGASAATVNFVVPSGAVVRGLSSGGIGIDTGTWPTGSYAISLTLTVQNGGIVDGGGGAGASGVVTGSNGGDAIYCRAPIGITINSGGTVRGGGGGGGGGARYNSGGPVDSRETMGGGGGGGGAPNGAAGSGTSGTLGAGANGSVGTTGGGGGGGAGGSGSGVFGGAGGNGGTFGAGGGTGGNASGGIAVGGAAGGAAGYAVRKNGFTIPVSNSGTMTGTAA